MLAHPEDASPILDTQYLEAYTHGTEFARVPYGGNKNGFPMDGPAFFPHDFAAQRIFGQLA
jgi:hypothetical protein